jgi:tRNA C32,U32 (ribose-2'-O)-methylase TrmJ
MPKRKVQQLNRGEIEKLLDRQTVTILNAVDEKLSKQQVHADQKILTLEKRLEKMEIRINQKIDRLTTTLDRFLKRLTTTEDEFEIMKADINRIKKVVREKLGVELL